MWLLTVLKVVLIVIGLVAVCSAVGLWVVRRSR